MAFNRSSFPNFSVNTHPDNSGVHRTAVDHDGNDMDLELDLHTQPGLGHRGHTLYSTNHHAGPQINMSRMEVYPTNSLNPGQSTPEGSDYWWFLDSSFSGANYMEGLGSARSTDMTYGRYQGTMPNTMNLGNNNNALHPAVFPHSSFLTSNTHAVHGTHSTVFMGTLDDGHVDIYAQHPNFGVIRTGTMPNMSARLTPTLPPSTPTASITTTAIATPTTVVDNDYNYGYGHDADHDYDAPASKLPEQGARASSSRRRGKTQKRTYRISYDSHASHRYTCHPCRISTDVKRDFARHLKTDKHKRKTQ